MTSSQVIISRKLFCPDFKEKYKTELCRNWLNGFCSFENKCVFAHGKDELREKNNLRTDDFQEVEEAEISTSPMVIKKKRLPVFVELSKRLSKETLI